MRGAASLLLLFLLPVLLCIHQVNSGGHIVIMENARSTKPVVVVFVTSAVVVDAVTSRQVNSGGRILLSWKMRGAASLLLLFLLPVLLCLMHSPGK